MIESVRPAPSRVEPTSDRPVVPVYGIGTLGAVLPGAAAALGVPTGLPALPFPEVRSVCVVIVDGLGADLLDAAGPGGPDSADRCEAPFLTGLTSVPRPAGCPDTLRVGCPTTTATSMGSFGTGQPPGRHGMVGYQIRDPIRGVLLNQLRWDPYTDPVDWQPLPTIFGLCVAAGIDVCRIGAEEFAGSGLTVAAHRGGTFVGAKELSARVDAAIAAAHRQTRSLIYLYWGGVDSAGHEHGCRSAEWRTEVRGTDAQLARLAAGLPPDTLLVITADHGMVDVPHAGRLDMASRPELRRDIAVFGGEPRMVQLYCRYGQVDEVATRMRDAVGDSAWVRTRAEAIDEGWFGPTEPRVADRIGDVLIAARGSFAIVDSGLQHKKSLALIGHHGSLTEAEQLVPLLVAGT
ncbi:MAG: alkaline phosphatase family protein [Actinobacteria bacterium]|nr:alkaline phosphatase family protein [Actinomycetota bacterium]